MPIQGVKSLTVNSGPTKLKRPSKIKAAKPLRLSGKSQRLDSRLSIHDKDICKGLGCYCTVCRGKAERNNKIVTSYTQNSIFCFTEVHGQGGRFKTLFCEWFMVYSALIQRIATPGAKPNVDVICNHLVPIAVSNIALAQTVVAAASSLKDGTTGVLELSTVALRDYGVGVKAVRGVMHNGDHALLMQDAAVLPLIFLAVSCLTFGLKEDLRQHCNGIHAVVRLRGGLHNYSAPIAHLIQWVEYYNNLYHDDMPIFGVASSSLVTLDKPPTDRYRSEFHRTELSLSASVLKSCQDIVLLNCLLNEAMIAPPVSSRFNYYMYKRNAVRTDIQKLHAAFHGTGGVDECVIYAMQAYRMAALAGRFSEHPLIYLCEKIRAVLIQTKLKTEWAGDTMRNLLIWCLWCTGGLVTEKWLEGKQWFARMLKSLLHRRYCNIAGPGWLDGWRTLEMLQLENYVWSSTQLLPYFTRMCMMIEQSETVGAVNDGDWPSIEPEA